MSNVVFLSSPYHGHINPTLGLVRELVDRGEKVFYYATEEFRKKIEDAGAVLLKYKLSEERDRKSDALYNLKLESDRLKIYAQAEIYAYIDSILNMGNTSAFFNIVRLDENLIKEIIGLKPDYIICDYTTKTGMSNKLFDNIPVITSFATFAYHHKIFKVNKYDAVKYFLRFNEKLADSAEGELSLISRKVSNGYKSDALNIVFTSREFQPYSDCFDDTYKFVGSSIYHACEPAGDLFDELDDRPMIYISLGSVLCNLENYSDFYNKCFESFGDTDFQVVLNVGSNDISGFGKIPNNFIVRNFVPQLDVLQRANVFITHGGFNSVTEGIYYNVPLVVIPMVNDQFLIADRVKKLGAGICVNKDSITSESLKNAVNKVLKDKRYYENCKYIENSFRASGGYIRAADEIFSLKERLGI